MGTKQLLTCIGLPELEQGFIDADEDLFADMSIVRVSMIRDVHYDSIELKVLVYGRENEEEDPPILESWIDPEVIASEGELPENGINLKQLRSLFTKDALGVILAFGVQVQWLCEDGYWLPLDFTQKDNNGVRLEPIDR